MAIEPLGSMMTVQAQPLQKVEPVKPVEVSTEAGATQSQQAVDPTTLTVQSVEAKGDGADSEGNGHIPEG